MGMSNIYSNNIIQGVSEVDMKTGYLVKRFCSQNTLTKTRARFPSATLIDKEIGEEDVPYELFNVNFPKFDGSN